MAVGKKYGGREKGTPNKNTYYVREAFKELVEGEVDNLHMRLQRLSDKEYFNVILKMAEFFTPKYQSVAVTVEDNKSDVMVALMALRDNKKEVKEED
jgi:hypothetical protein